MRMRATRAANAAFNQPRNRWKKALSLLTIRTTGEDDVPACSRSRKGSECDRLLLFETALRGGCAVVCSPAYRVCAARVCNARSLARSLVTRSALQNFSAGNRVPLNAQGRTYISRGAS